MLPFASCCTSRTTGTGDPPTLLSQLKPLAANRKLELRWNMCYKLSIAVKLSVADPGEGVPIYSAPHLTPPPLLLTGFWIGHQYCYRCRIVVFVYLVLTIHAELIFLVAVNFRDISTRIFTIKTHEASVTK